MKIKRFAFALALLTIGMFPISAAVSRAADPGSHESHHPGASRPIDIGDRYCMTGSEGTGGAMMGGLMTGMMTGTMHGAKPEPDVPDGGMSAPDCSANHSASSGHEKVPERGATGCGA